MIGDFDRKTGVIVFRTISWSSGTMIRPDDLLLGHLRFVDTDPKPNYPFYVMRGIDSALSDEKAVRRRKRNSNVIILKPAAKEKSLLRHSAGLILKLEFSQGVSRRGLGMNCGCV